MSTMTAKEWMHATRQHVAADAYSFLRAIIRINCSNTHSHTQTAW